MEVKSRISLAPESTSEAARSLHPQTRSETLIGVLDRLINDSKIIQMSKLKGRFVLHVVGADENECPVLDSNVLIAIYEDILKKLKSLDIHRVAILFSGPNLIQDESSRSSITFLFDDSLEVTIYSASCCFHEIDKSLLLADHAYATLTLMYNPGIWGYSSWLTTLSSFFEDSSRAEEDIKPIYVMTAYTLEEAEEDYDNVVAHFESQGLRSLVLPSDQPSIQFESTESIGKLTTLAWLWECQPNPHCKAPALERRSAATSSPYRDSQFWSAFIFN